MRGDDWLANYAAWPGQENWLPEASVTASSHETVSSNRNYQGGTCATVYLEFQFSRGSHACMIVEHNNATLFLRCC